jgi:hypothetical protein
MMRIITPIKENLSQEWRPIPVIPALGKLRQEDHGFEASEILSQKTNKTKLTRNTNTGNVPCNFKY